MDPLPATAGDDDRALSRIDLLRFFFPKELMARPFLSSVRNASSKGNQAHEISMTSGRPHCFEAAERDSLPAILRGVVGRFRPRFAPSRAGPIGMTPISQAFSTSQSHFGPLISAWQRTRVQSAMRMRVPFFLSEDHAFDAFRRLTDCNPTLIREVFPVEKINHIAGFFRSTRLHGALQNLKA